MANSRLALGALAALSALYLFTRHGPEPTNSAPLAMPAAAPDTNSQGNPGSNPDGTTNAVKVPASAQPKLAPFVAKALDWLADAQQQDGGFGAGSHARQEIRDAHAVPTDPATTAVAAIALLRAGNGLDHGDHAAVLGRATECLLRTVEASKDEGPQITELTGTQPQAKMGQNVDTALTAQYLARLLPELAADAPLRPRVAKALDKCLHKIEGSQSKDGSWAAGGWAPVLQSAQMSTALELSQTAGRPVDEEKLAQARSYQRSQVSPGPTGPSTPGPAAGTRAEFFLGAVRSDAAAGVELYASAANARGVATDARAAAQIVEEAKQAGRLQGDAKVDVKTLLDAGVVAPRAKELAEAFAMNAAAKVRAFDDRMLDGFGNNGGEEFLSYQMKSESLAIDGGEEWAKWSAKMQERLAKVQNQDGSWSGHHCITSPVFCTATAISCLLADRDVEWLRNGSKLARR